MPHQIKIKQKERKTFSWNTRVHIEILSGYVHVWNAERPFLSFCVEWIPNKFSAQKKDRIFFESKKKTKNVTLTERKNDNSVMMEQQQKKKNT